MWAPGGQWNQWPMDAAAYQNMNPDHVDWGSLAQQWIRMKEVHETVVINVPVAPMGMAHFMSEGVRLLPPPQSVASFPSEASTSYGEAPMDVVKDELDDNADSSQDSSSWGSVPQLGWQQRQHLAAPKATQQQQPYLPQAFRAGAGVPLPLRFPPIPPPRQGSSDEDSGGATMVASSPFPLLPMMDAAKKKQLPAWIREGLEKMEREKLKREEREKFLQDREQRRRKQLESNSSADTRSLMRSRFDDDEDDDDDVEENNETKQDIHKEESTLLQSKDVMMTIRRLMTEILLEVTTEEIQMACQEVHQRSKVKSRQAQPSQTSKSLIEKLGLDQYGSDSGEDDAEPAVGRISGIPEEVLQGRDSEGERHSENGGLGDRARRPVQVDKQRDHDVEEGQHKKRIEESLSKTNSTKVDTDSTVNIADGSEGKTSQGRGRDLRDCSSPPSGDERANVGKLDSKRSCSPLREKDARGGQSKERETRDSKDRRRSGSRRRDRSRDRRRSGSRRRDRSGDRRRSGSRRRDRSRDRGSSTRQRDRCAGRDRSGSRRRNRSQERKGSSGRRGDRPGDKGSIRRSRSRSHRSMKSPSTDRNSSRSRVR